MIWGKTDYQKDCEWNSKKIRLRHWKKWFAWYPVKLDDTRMAWLCYVERRVLPNNFSVWIPEYRELRA